MRDPRDRNHHGDTPEVARVDLVVGDVTGVVEDRSSDLNPTTTVARRFTPVDWTRSGEWLTITHELALTGRPSYFRLRGTNTNELEPSLDPRGEDPWSDLWFYSNPVFVEHR